MWIVILALTSLTAFAQFGPLAPTNLTPNVQITCKTSSLFSTIDVKIDVQAGTATQIMGDNKYVYKLDNFTFQKFPGEGSVNLNLKGSLDQVVSTITGEPVKAGITSSNFKFNSKLPVKDGKKFTAKSFHIASDVKFSTGSSFSIDDKTTNSTKCVLDKGGPAIKKMNVNSSMKISANYPKANIDDSDRAILTKDPLAAPVPDSSTGMKSEQQ